MICCVAAVGHNDVYGPAAGAVLDNVVDIDVNLDGGRLRRDQVHGEKSGSTIAFHQVGGVAFKVRRGDSDVLKKRSKIAQKAI